MKNTPNRKMTGNLQFVMSQHHSIQFEFKRETHTETKKESDKVRSEVTPAYSEEIERKKGKKIRENNVGAFIAFLFVK